MAQFWCWKKLFVNDADKLLKWELWSLQLCVQMIIASWGGVVEYFGVIAPKKKNQIYVKSHHPRTSSHARTQTRTKCHDSTTSFEVVEKKKN